MIMVLPMVKRIMTTINRSFEDSILMESHSEFFPGIKMNTILNTDKTIWLTKSKRYAIITKAVFIWL